jgi:flagellar M-ring protein FliF
MSALQFFRGMSYQRLVLLGFGLLTIVVAGIFYMSKVSGRDMVLLYSDLESSDSTKILQELDSKNIPYQILNDGSAIKVPRHEVSEIRVALAQISLPTKGSIVGYEIFDKEDTIGTTNFSQNIKMSRALEGEIARTLSSFEQVDKVRVHLVLPQKEIFSKERLDPRASVVIRFKKNKTFNKSEIDAVGHFIVTAVPGLSLKNLTIVDAKGKPLKLGAEEDSDDLALGKNEEYRVAYETRLKKVIEDLLEQSVGAGKVRVQVSTEMNFDRIVTNTESYDPDNIATRSVQNLDERESTPVAGEDNTDISVANNLPGGYGDRQHPNLAVTEKSEQTTNYEVSKTVKSQITETGRVTRLSIGVLVDGTYKIDQEGKSAEYIPRTKAEMDNITNLVKVASGFNTQRQDQIEVLNMQFVNDLSILIPDDTDSWLIEELPNLFQTLVFAVVVVLVLVTVIRPITLKAFEMRRIGIEPSGTQGRPITPKDPSSPATQASSAKAGERSAEGQELLEKITSRVEINNQRVNDLITFYPQEMLNVLRKWLDESK